MQTRPHLHEDNPRKVDFSVFWPLECLGIRTQVRIARPLLVWVSGLESGYRDPGLGIRTFLSGYPDTYLLHYPDFCESGYPGRPGYPESGYRDPSVLLQCEEAET